MLGATEIAIIVFAIGVFCFGPMFLKKAGAAAADTIREFRKVKAELSEPIERNDTPNKSDTGHPLPAATIAPRTGGD